ncbi:MAG: ATP-binding protein [Oscillospiraceae bacterium]
MAKLISAEELRSLDCGEYNIIDIRDEYSYSFGHIDNARLVSPKLSDGALMDELSALSGKKLIVCGSGGIMGGEFADRLCALGFDALNLDGGYIDWLRTTLETGESKADEAERSIRKKFHSCILSKFTKALNEYQLINEGDKIAVCISGGKDSMLMAKLFQEIKRHNKMEFEVVFLLMDPGYSPANRRIIEKNAELLDIPLTIFETDIFSSVFNVRTNPCYLCARMRRGNLYAKAKELGCNKIALGHHFDDVIETILMGMIYGGQVQTMMPKLHSANFPGMELIRPMYFVREEDVKRWRDYNGLHFIQCACKFTDQAASENDNEHTSKRQEIKQLIARLSKINPQIEMNIFRSVEGVNLKTLPSYKDLDGNLHHFLDEYEKY